MLLHRCLQHHGWAPCNQGAHLAAAALPAEPSHQAGEAQQAAAGTASPPELDLCADWLQGELAGLMPGAAASELYSDRLAQQRLRSRQQPAAVPATSAPVLLARQMHGGPRC